MTHQFVGIVGHGADKFTTETQRQARAVIRGILRRYPGCVVVSGHAPVGGIDIWAEQEAKGAGHDLTIFPPEVDQWEDRGSKWGFKSRNLAIADLSTIVHNIVVAELPPGYTGRRFKTCYHCKGRHPEHVKSGGCWTAWQARETFNHEAEWWIL